MADLALAPNVKFQEDVFTALLLRNNWWEVRVRGGERPKHPLRLLCCPVREGLAKLCAAWKRLEVGWDEPERAF